MPGPQCSRTRTEDDGPAASRVATLAWNRGAERLYGYAAQEVIGRSISLLIPEGQPDELRTRTAGCPEPPRRGPGLEVEPGRCMMPGESLLKLAGTPTPVENSPQGAEKCSPPRVLVVDDEALIRWSVAETLGDQGWQVTEAADAESAMVAFPEIAEASGLVFLDLRLPDSDDLHVLAAMHRLSPGTPVILMTAHRTPNLAEEARALGAFAVIDKPFDVGDLVPLAKRASGHGRA